MHNSPPWAQRTPSEWKLSLSVPSAASAVRTVLVWMVVSLVVSACSSNAPAVSGPSTPYPTLPRPLPTLTPGAPKPADAFPAQPASASAGEAHYRTLCANCHGDTANGDTTLGRTLTPRPANFHDAEFVRRRTPASFYHSVQKGVLGSAMLGYEGTLSPAQTWDVIAFLWRQSAADADVDKGRQLYAAQCAACHGARGEGGSAGSLAAPALLAGRTGYGMFNAISGGLPDAPTHRWDTLPDADRWAIVDYVWTFMLQR